MDLSTLLPGPFATQMLAIYGAEVIKIEPPRGDFLRYYPFFFQGINRNKSSLKLNLKTEEGKKIFFELVKTADVIIEQFRPGVMKKLGLDYEICKQVNPRIIYCSISAYGQTGPYVTYPGHDLNVLGLAGLLSPQVKEIQAGSVSSPLPFVLITDVTSGFYCIIGILLALFHRKISNIGQYIDVSMLDGAITWLSGIDLAMKWLNGESVNSKDVETYFSMGNLAWYSLYKTKDEKVLSVAAFEPHFWKAFCETLGVSQFTERQYDSIEKQTEMRRKIQSILSSEPRDHWIRLFTEGKNGIAKNCVAPVHQVDEVHNDLQVKEREMIVDLPHMGGGNFKGITTPLKMTTVNIEEPKAPPSLGQHGEEILEKLGYSLKEIEELKEKKVI